MQLLRNRLVATARKCMSENSSLGQVYESMQEAYQQMQTPLIYQEPSALVYWLFCFFNQFKHESVILGDQIVS